jgi:hypothetical protein
MGTIALLNAEPMHIAIWNDATSCVDIGDVTLMKVGASERELLFIELKEGRVNQAILDVFSAGSSMHGRKLAEFEAAFGEKGMAQLKRVVRQKEVNQQALTLLNDERGVDPVSGEDVRVLEVDVEMEHYDNAMNQMLLRALETKVETLEVIDGCLWIYANADPGSNRSTVRRQFQDRLERHSPTFRESLARRRPRGDHDRIVSLNESFEVPMAKPIFLRRFNPQVVGAISFGALMFRVFLYVDWAAFASLVKQEGGELTWSSEKATRRYKAERRNRQPAFVGERVPQIRVGSTTSAVTEPNLVEMLFDGVTPRCMVKRILATPTSVKELED